MRLLIAILRFLNGDETAVSRFFDRNREARGYQALSDGMVALAAGEGRLALIKAQRAEKRRGQSERMIIGALSLVFLLAGLVKPADLRRNMPYEIILVIGSALVISDVMRKTW